MMDERMEKMENLQLQGKNKKSFEKNQSKMLMQHFFRS
jgi:hypothetical protein